MTTQQYRSLSEFRHQIRRFLAFSEKEARAAGIDPRQHQVLLAVKGLPKGGVPTIGALAERLQVRHNSLVELVDRMVAQKLVLRRPDAADRRQVLVSITPRGERILEKLSLAHREELKQAGPRLVGALEPLVALKKPSARKESRT